MKKILCVFAVSAILAACGSGANNNNGSDTTTKVGPDTTMQADTSNMMMDTTHKDSVVH
ncbi:MAG TPA: hypothetical protein VG738_16460 [Chitinophagaceae bacterium]|nr:hypothetical protein [Chitinophagaceae bacterium]